MHLLIFFVLVAGAALAQTPAADSTEKEQPSQELKPLTTTVTVNGNVNAETPSSIAIFDQKKIEQTPGVNLDDRLRQVPGFSLFRRTSSLVANPTTQGVSLRAVGSTGASRSLVLLDGVPLNDPFGGWVYWTRVDPFQIDRAEVIRGSSTSAFGDRAMSGAISMFQREPAPKQSLDFSYFGGNLGQNEVSGSYSRLFSNRFGVSGYSRAFTTDGYYITPTELRGAADRRANVEFATGDVRLYYLGDNDRLSVNFNLLAEARQNGTIQQNNSTSLGTISTNYTHTWARDQVSFLGFHTREQFHSTYSAVSADRNTDRLTAIQTVPAEDLGGALFWQHRAEKWTTLVGADVDNAHGISRDRSLMTNVTTNSGGTLLQHGVFGQATYQLGPVKLFAGIRHHFTGLGGTLVSPNGAVTVGSRSFKWRTAAYRSFRVPTLNELYRQFRVGNALTLANAGLTPERLLSVETGVDWVHKSSKVSVTIFRNELQNLIANATLSVTPNMILRQRQNLGEGLSRGVEASVSHQWRNWSADAGYLFADARLSTGPRLAQIPKHQGTGAVTYNARGTLVSAGVRAFGLQFDDDINLFRLPGYAALQLSARQNVKYGFSVLAQVENLLDRSFLVALTPTPNTGAPRLWRVGVRWSSTAR